MREYPKSQFYDKTESMISDIEKEIAIFAANQQIFYGFQEN